MRRILFRWRGFTVWSYPAMLYLGLVSAVVAGNLGAHAARLDPLRTFVAMHLLIIAALLGARFLYVVSHWPLYRAHPRQILSRRDGGASMYGALPVTLALSVPLLAALGLPLGAFWDVASLSILAGMICTRIGCLLNGCCVGRPSETWLGVSLPDSLGVWQRRIPTQLLEAAWAAVLLLGARAAWGRLPFSGALFLCVAAGYAGGRLVLESMRESALGGRMPTIHHAISVAVLVSSLAMLTAHWPN